MAYLVKWNLTKMNQFLQDLAVSWQDFLLGKTFSKELTVPILLVSSEIFILIRISTLSTCFEANHTPNSTTYLKHFVQRRFFAWDQVGGAEGELLHLSEVIGGVLVEHHTPYLDERILQLRPYLQQQKLLITLCDYKLPAPPSIYHSEKHLQVFVYC